MSRNIHHAFTEDQPPARSVAAPTAPTNRQSVPPTEPQRPRPRNRRRRSRTTCHQTNCRNGDLCRDDHTLSPADQITGPSTVAPDPHQRRTASHSFTHERDHTPRRQLPQLRPHCKEWLKGNCPQRQWCSFTHDPEARAAEEVRLEKIAEELRLKKVTEELAAKEAAATVDELVLPSTKVTFGAGVTVNKVLTGYETCKVLIKNLPLTATSAEVVTLFTQPGFDPAKFTVYPPRPSPSDRSHLEAMVEFESLVDGENAAVGLDEIEFGLENLKLSLIRNQGGMGKSEDLDPNVLTVTWPAPSQTVFASYSSLEEARSQRTQLEKKTFNGRKVKTNIAKKPPNFPNRRWNCATLVVNGLEPTASLTSIQEFCGATSIWIPSSDTRSYDLDEAMPSLRSLVIETHPEDHHSVTYEPNLVPNDRGIVSVKIRFPTWEHAKVVRDLLDQMPLPFCPQIKYFVTLPNPLHYTIHVPWPQYRAQENLFSSLITTQADGTTTACLRIVANQPNRPARIKLSGSDKKTIGRLKVRVEQLVAGEKLPQWDRVFHRAQGERFLWEVNDQTGAYIRIDKRQRTLEAFGEPAAVEQAKAMIQEEMDRLASLEFEVPLKRASVRFFVDGARGSELLKQEIGEESFRVDVSSIPCKIVVRGGESARHCLKKLVDESLSDAVRSQHQLKDGEICPVCYDSIDQPYRLGCGHAYCYGCLRHFLITASDTKVFPLSCMGDEGKCGLPVPLPVIRRFLVPAQVRRLLEVSFLDYLDHHPEEFKYCTTPDCPEIYSVESGPGRGIFQCRSCLVSVCGSCLEDHEGFECEEWKRHRDSETRERLLEGWAEDNDNVKKCPRCQVLIEKNGGCNHVTCGRCEVHICWRCMGVFSMEEIYGHMTHAHGGIDDEDLDLDGDDGDMDEPVGVGWGELAEVGWDEPAEVGWDEILGEGRDETAGEGWGELVGVAWDEPVLVALD